MGMHYIPKVGRNGNNKKEPEEHSQQPYKEEISKGDVGVLF
jgi:hypothetical protein